MATPLSVVVKDKTIRFWRLDGTLLGQALRAHEDWVTSVAFSPDGQTIVSGSSDKTIRLWNLDGTPVGEPFQGHEDSVWSVAFSPDGQTIVSGSSDKTIRLWNLDGTPVGEPFQGHEDSVWSVAFSPNGQTIVSGSSDKTIRLWNLDGTPVGEPFQGHEGWVVSVAFSPDGQIIASGGSTILLWRLDGTPVGQPLLGHEHTVWSVAFSPDGNTIVSGSEDKTIRLWPSPHVTFCKLIRNLAARRTKISVPQGVANDLAQGEDQLNVKDEIEALATVLMLRDLRPPIAVGLLGSWGSGKSFGMYLIQQKINEIRCQSLTSEQAWGDQGFPKETEKMFPFVGHIYQISFNAWTYAKSDLWASLMQEIFYELNRQISVEQELGRVLSGFYNSSGEETSSSESATTETSESSSTSFNNLLNSITVENVLLEGKEIWQAIYLRNEQERAIFFEENSKFTDLKSKDFKKKISDADWNNHLWNALENIKEAEQKSFKKQEEELQKKEKDLLEIRDQQSQLKSQEAGVDPKLAQRSMTVFFLPLINILAKLPFKKDEHKELTEVSETVEILRQTFTSWQGCIALFIMTLIVILTLWIQKITIPIGVQAFTVITAAATAILPILKVLKDYAISVQGRQQEIQNAHNKKIEQLEKDAEQLEKDAEQLEKDVEQLKFQVEKQRKQVGLTAYKTLMDFVSERLQGEDYDKRLGLMQQVKQDLAALSDQLTDNAHNQEQLKRFFPRGPVRVVLYIDDLDRCPPNRVVEILEAVQLLLNTKLFIVILGIDDRYIARALEQVYKGVLKRGGKPSGIDYLEKIIQIPYRMRPISPESVDNYLRSQVKIRPLIPITTSEKPPSPISFSKPESGTKRPIKPYENKKKPVDQGSNVGRSQPNLKDQPNKDKPLKKPSPATIQNNKSSASQVSLDIMASVIEFEETEFQLLVQCCKYVDITPRTAKRLINIYKILQIIWLTRSQQKPPRPVPTEQDKRIVMSFLALSGRYPSYMRSLFEEIDVLLEEKMLGYTQTDSTDNPTLEYPLDNLLKPENFLIKEHDLYANREWRKFKSDIEKMLRDPKENKEELIQLRIDRATFDLMLSFCFVGDIGYDPDDFQSYDRLHNTTEH